MQWYIYRLGLHLFPWSARLDLSQGNSHSIIMILPQKISLVCLLYIFAYFLYFFQPFLLFYLSFHCFISFNNSFFLFLSLFSSFYLLSWKASKGGGGGGGYGTLYTTLYTLSGILCKINRRRKNIWKKSLLLLCCGCEKIFFRMN